MEENEKRSEDWRQRVFRKINSTVDPLGLGGHVNIGEWNHNGKKGLQISVVSMGWGWLQDVKSKSRYHIHPVKDLCIIFRVLTQEMWLLQMHNIYSNLPCHVGWMIAYQ